MNLKKSLVILLVLVLGFFLVACEQKDPKEDLTEKIDSFLSTNEQFKITQNTSSETIIPDNEPETSEDSSVIYTNLDGSYIIEVNEEYSTHKILNNGYVKEYDVPNSLLSGSNTKAAVFNYDYEVDESYSNPLMLTEIDLADFDVARLGDNHFKIDISYEDFLEMIGQSSSPGELEGATISCSIEFITSGDSIEMIVDLHIEMEVVGIGKFEMNTHAQAVIVPHAFDMISFDTDAYFLYTSDIAIAPNIAVGKEYKITLPSEYISLCYVNVELEVGTYTVYKPVSSNVFLYQSGTQINSFYDDFEDSEITLEITEAGVYTIQFAPYAHDYQAVLLLSIIKN